MVSDVFKLAAMVVFIALGLNVNAQETSNREIGIRFSGLEDFDFVFKKGRSQDRYFRHRLGSLNIGVNDFGDERIWNFGLTYAFGIENRKAINEKLKFIYGFEPRVGFSYATNTFRSQGWSSHLGLGYVLGFQYDFAESFYMNIETIPALTYARSSPDGNKAFNSFNAGFSSNGVALSLVYKF